MRLTNHPAWGLCVAILFAVMGTGCQQNTHNAHHELGQTSLKNETGRATSGTASTPDTSKPVVQFGENLDDQVTDNDFTVSLYPTVEATVFEAHIRYGGNEVNQDITMLPKSYYQRIVLKKGSSAGSCLVGFIDMDGKFNEMKLITASGTSIAVKTLKEYYLSNQ